MKKVHCVVLKKGGREKMDPFSGLMMNAEAWCPVPKLHTLSAARAVVILPASRRFASAPASVCSKGHGALQTDKKGM